MPKLLIATENKGKRRELQQLLGDLLPSAGLDLILPSEAGLSLSVEETGSSYAENAALKAVAYANASGLIALADDSGLEVDALGGAPGLYSARFGAPAYLLSDLRALPNGSRKGVLDAGATGEGRLSDADRRAYLLQNLSDKPRPWTARFRASVAIARPAGEVRSVEGVCPGEIIPEERGTGGFGYDPIFLLAGHTQTMAELPDEEKNRLSHRGRAVQAAIPILREMLGL
jgi:XTP/dITP diphosphohydrolase